VFADACRGFVAGCPVDTGRGDLTGVARSGVVVALPARRGARA
jgi:hypothetical protein